MFKKILIANRGEIAVRIIRACKELNIIAGVIYSDIDSTSLHVRMSDESYLVGKAKPEDSYLNIKKIISVAKENGFNALHPGYGFLAENAGFIKKVEEAGLKFIGPSADVVKLMGDKLAARKFVESINVPVVPGTIVPANNVKDVKKIADKIGYPIILKAAAGGGGKGMRVVEDSKDIENSLERAQSESLAAFNDDRVYVEKYIDKPKHIEVQVLSDEYGNHIHLFERECSVQRRHQKIIEEAPSASISEEKRNEITDSALKIVRSSNYKNAGTVEFLYDNKGNHYFLEMNTRLQVEHPVTEAITGVDIVKEQIRIASGLPLSIKQEELKINGYAIECRINAEDPYNNFFPSAGKIEYYSTPDGSGIRVDSGFTLNSEVTLNYDSLLCKIAVHAKTREETISKMKNALKEFKLSGVITNLPVHLWILENEIFIKCGHDIKFLEQNYHFSIEQETNNDGENAEFAALAGVHLKNLKKNMSPRKLFNESYNRWFENE